MRRRASLRKPRLSTENRSIRVKGFLPRGDLTTIAELNDLGLFYERRERFQDAEEYYKRALTQFDGLAGDCSLMDSNLARVVGNYARFMYTEGKIHEFEQLMNRAKVIRSGLSGNCSKH
jgi:tetratricopeptide (TPR) repeat protein